MKLKNHVLQAAYTSELSNITLITHLTKNMDDGELQDLQKYKTINDIVTRKRNEKFNKHDYKQDDIPEFLKKDLCGNKFVRFDSGVSDNERFIIFYTDFAEKYFTKIENVLVDGTFWSVPSEFTQLITFNFQVFENFFH
jgi:hypothetical protein